jgi:hypothetical protein
MTYGELRFTITKLLPGLDPDLIDSWISGRYTQVLDELTWTRREVRSIVQTSAVYEEGTVTLTNGSTAVTGVGTTFTSGHTGAGLIPAGRNEYYEFVYSSATAGVLDRAFEGETGSYSYKLFQSVYQLPSDCRVLLSVRDLHAGPLSPASRSEVQAIVGVPVGPPQYYRQHMDDLSSPPRMQIELYPAPEDVRSLEVEYLAEETTFGTTTATTLLPWLRPACLIAGVYADGLNRLKEFNAADRQELKFSGLLAQMRKTAILNIPQKRIQISNRFRPGTRSDLIALRKSQMP